MSKYYYLQKNLIVKGHERSIKKILILNDGRFVDFSSDDKSIHFYDKLTFKLQFKIEYQGWRKTPFYIHQLKNGDFLTTSENNILRIYKLKNVDFLDDEEESMDSINKDDIYEEIIETKYYLLKEKISISPHGKIIKIIENGDDSFITLCFCTSFCIWKKNEVGRYVIINGSGRETPADGLLIKQNFLIISFYYQGEIQFWKINNYENPILENKIQDCKPNNSNSVLSLDSNELFLFVGGSENIFVVDIKEYKIIININSSRVNSLINIYLNDNNYLFISDDEGNISEYLFSNNELKFLTEIKNENKMKKKSIRNFLYYKKKLIACSNDGTISFMELIEKIKPEEEKKIEEKEKDDEDDDDDKYRRYRHHHHPHEFDEEFEKMMFFDMMKKKRYKK